MGNGYDVPSYSVLETFLLGAKYIKHESHVQVDEPPQYSPNPRQAGRDTGIRSSWFFLHQLTFEDYLLSEDLELVSHVSYRPCGCRGHQEGVPLQL